MLEMRKTSELTHLLLTKAHQIVHQDEVQYKEKSWRVTPHIPPFFSVFYTCSFIMSPHGPTKSKVPIYSTHAKRNSTKRQSNKFAPVPRTRRISSNSPVVRRCSLQEDQSILMFQAKMKKQDFAARRQSLDIIEMREEILTEVENNLANQAPKLSNSMISLDVEKLKRQAKLAGKIAVDSFRRIPYVIRPRTNSCRSSSMGSIASKGSKGQSETQLFVFDKCPTDRAMADWGSPCQHHTAKPRHSRLFLLSTALSSFSLPHFGHQFLLLVFGQNTGSQVNRL